MKRYVTNIQQWLVWGHWKREREGVVYIVSNIFRIIKEKWQGKDHFY